MNSRNKQKAMRANQGLNSRIDELQKKPYGALKLIGIAIVIGLIVAALATCSNARAEESKQCKPDDIYLPEKGLPDHAVLYQVVKFYCVGGRVWALGMDAISPPIPQLTGRPCDMNKPFVLRGAGKPA